MEEKKLDTKEIILSAVVVLVLIALGAFLYIQSKDKQTVPVEEDTGLTVDEKRAIEARINNAPVIELTPEEKSAIEERINNAPVIELTPEEKASIEARINQ